MKKLTAIVLLVGLCSILSAQTTETLTSKTMTAQVMVVDSEFSDIHIDAWDKDYVKAIVKTKITEGSAQKYEVELEESQNKVELIGKLLNTKMISKNCTTNIEIDITVYVPSGKKLKLESKFGDVEIQGDFTSYDVKTEFGDCTIKKPRKGFGDDSRFVSKFGDLDIAMLETEDVYFQTTSSFGDVWTDLPLSTPKSTCLSCPKSQYTMNNGDQKVTLSSNFGDIYLRKL